jgi:hydrogenase-4 component H
MEISSPAGTGVVDGVTGEFLRRKKMLFSWIRRGLRTGVLTTRYPAVQEQLPEAFRGKPVLDASRCIAEQGCSACVQVCLPQALSLPEAVETAGNEATELVLDYARCIACGLCVNACPQQALRMTNDYELAASKREDLRIVTLFEPGEKSGDENGKEGNNGRYA